MAEQWIIDNEQDDPWSTEAWRRARIHPVVWCNDPVFLDRRSASQCAKSGARHYPFAPPDKPGMLGFYATLAHARARRLTFMSPGRYLTRYYKDVLTERQIKDLAEWQKNGRPSPYDGLELHYATTEQEIAKVYRAGPFSCMKDFPERTHPARVYAAGDLQVAYLWKPPSDGRPGEVIARALVWPERKVVGRVYPTPEEHWPQSPEYKDAVDRKRALSNKLKKLAYTSYLAGGSFDGARIQLQKMRGTRDTWSGRVYPRVRIPYLDGGYNFRLSDDAAGLTMVKGHFGERRIIPGDYTEGYATLEPDMLTPITRANDDAELQEAA